MPAATIAPCDWSAAVRHLKKADPALAPLITRVGPPTMAPTTDPVQSVARAIVYQQLAGAAASTIYGRFLALYPGKRFPAAKRLAATPHETLRTAGLSGAKAAALLDLAAHVTSRRLVPKDLYALADHEVAAALLPVRGIGPWSVDMFLMFALCRGDVLPVGDLGVKKGVQRHFGLRALPDADRMTKLTERWRPFRTAGAWYMWRLLEQTAD